MDTLTAPLQEQSVCIHCGFCCDGTLFMHAHLDEGERGNLPGEIEKAAFTESGKDYFRLPCRYFAGRCTIYDQQRAYVCGSYRCQLLKDLAEGKISAEEAHETVRKAFAMRKTLMQNFRKVTVNRRNLFFRQLLIELGKIQKSTLESQPPGDDLDMLIARCNIFEALLIRHFRSADDFGKMVMK